MAAFVWRRQTKPEEEEAETRLNPIARVLLQGIYDFESELHKLNGMWFILRKIWKFVTSYWKANIECRPFDSECRKTMRNADFVVPFLRLTEPGNTLFNEYICMNGPYIGSTIKFPKPSAIDINMMPFVMGRAFEECCLPDYLKSYWKNIISLCPLGDEIGRIGYLTIQESCVEDKTSQRRPGIHTERPGKVKLLVPEESNRNADGLMENIAGGEGHSFLRRSSFGWGMGNYRRVQEGGELIGGIYMASNVEKSCRIWNCQIMDDNMIGELGNIEHLRDFLPESEFMAKNELYWLTDRTPHESFRLTQRTHRQFFRLVTSQVSLWYEDHSTKNPLGVVPDPEITQIVMGSKFAETGVTQLKHAK